MNELIAILITAAYMAVAYFFIYPKAKGITQLRWLDLMFSILAIGTIGLVFAGENPMAELFGLNWFVFAVLVYVVLETPAWYLYMQSHPHQGSIAQLYGFAPKSNDKVAKNMQKVMQDTKWDPIRTGRVQKLLVVLGAVSIATAPGVFWFEDLMKPGFGILAVFPVFLIWWLLRISVRLVADAPDQYLDEFQTKQRDRTYLHAFRLLAAIMSCLAVVLMVVTISKDVSTVGSVEYFEFAMTFGQVNAVIWLILGSVILLPNMVLAWTQSKRKAI